MIKRLMGRLGFLVIDCVAGTKIMSVLKRLGKEQYHSYDQLKEKARQEALTLFANAKRHTHYYRQFETFEAVPETTKTVVRENFCSLLMDNAPKWQKIKKTTSGSTGEPVVYYSSKLARSYLWAGLLLSWQAAGYELGDRVCFLAGAALFKIRSWKDKLKYALMGIYPMSAFGMTDSVKDQLLNALIDKKIDFIYGYTTSVQLLAAHAKRTAFSKQYQIKACIVTAEALTEKARAEISEGFNCPVFNQYGVDDAGVSAFECHYHNGLHFILSRAYPEINERGELLATDLKNDIMPLIRANTGDVVHFSDQPCSCGRGYPLISELVGRSADGVWKRDGQWLPSTLFIFLFMSKEHVSRFQLVQRKDFSIELLLDMNGPFDEAHYRTELEEHFDELPLTIYTDRPFVEMKNGKIRPVFSEIKEFSTPEW